MSGPPKPPEGVTGLCRCMTCCCNPGQGHNHPDWAAYERAARAWDDRAIARVTEQLTDPPEVHLPPPLTDGPERCDAYLGTHTNPHRGCILR